MGGRSPHDLGSCSIPSPPSVPEAGILSCLVWRSCFCPAPTRHICAPGPHPRGASGVLQDEDRPRVALQQRETLSFVGTGQSEEPHRKAVPEGAVGWGRTQAGRGVLCVLRMQALREWLC